MKIYLKDQRNNFKKHLYVLKEIPLMDFDKTKLKENCSTIELSATKKMEELNLDFLFNYAIFPKKIMTYNTQWSEEERGIEIGDTIVQQEYVPPLKCCSQKIVFGVRITEIFNQTHKKGFSYVTLVGHIEKGISTFYIQQIENKLFFTIHSFSLPGNMLAKILGPIFSIPYQRFCTNEALKNVKKQIEEQ